MQEAIFNRSSYSEVASAKNIEFMTAGLIIAAVSAFALANLTIGFSLWLYLFSMIFGITLSVFFPRSGVYAIILLTFVFERFFTLVPVFLNRAEYKIYPIDLLMLAVILGIVIQMIAGKIKIRINKADWVMIIFLLSTILYFVACIVSGGGNSDTAFSTFKNYFFYGLFYFIILALFQKRGDLANLLKLFLISGAVIIFFTLIGIMRGEGLWTEYTPLSTAGVRILAFTHSFFMSMAILIALAWLAVRSGKYNTYLKVLIPLWLAGVVGSLMRHLWISIATAVIITILLLGKEARFRMRSLFLNYCFIGLLLLIVAIYASMLFPNSGFSDLMNNVMDVTGTRFTSTVQVSQDESLNWRASVWESAWQELKHSPVFGIGYGKSVPVEIGLKYKDFVEIRNIHNSLLTIFIQMGVWGLALFLVLIWLIIKPFLKSKNSRIENGEDKFLRIAFLALLVNFLVAFLFQTYLETNLLGMFLWIILGGLSVLGAHAHGRSNIVKPGVN